MIKLFDYFNNHSRKLYESFKASKLEEDLTIVLNDNGFLPDDVISSLKNTTYAADETDGE